MGNYENIDIKRMMEIIFSKKLLIALIMLLSITLGYVYSYYYKQPEYKSSVTILLVADENKLNQGLTQNDLSINSSLISTYSSIAKSTNVIQKTIENLGLNINAENLQKNIEAIPVDKTQILKITVKNNNPEIAKNIANELAKVFTAQIKEIYNLENISIVDEAEIENQPFNINHKKDMILFGIMGVIASSILVFGIYLFDDTIKNEKDIEKNVKLKNIGTVPLDRENNELIIEDNPKSQIVESIKTLRTNVFYTTHKKTILVTSSRPKEGKSWIVNNLAASFAQANKKVILVDTDLRKENNRNEIFDVEKGEGLSDFIKEISDNKLENLQISKRYIKETKIPNLHMLQKGTLPPNPSELITSEKMKKLLDLLKSMYDVILLDGTPCMVVADSVALSSMVDATILVAECGQTKINDLRKTNRMIEDVNGKVLGVISNKSDVQKGKYYGKGYGYYYGKDVEKIEEIAEKPKVISLDKVIQIAEENIKEENIKEENIIKEEIVIENQELPQNNRQVNDEIKSIKSEILKEIRKIKNTFSELKRDNSKNQIDNIISDIKSLKEIQENNNRNILEQIENINKKHFDTYEKILAKINEELSNNVKGQMEKLQGVQEKNIEAIEQVKEEFVTEIGNLKHEINDLRENQNSNNSELLEKIENMNYDERIEQINNKIQETELKNTGNIISFESLKKRKKSNKKVFKINEIIEFEDLQRLSTCVIDFNENSTSAEAMNN